MPTLRRCPSCRADISAHTHGRLTLDICQVCGGIFFEAGELARLRRDDGGLEAVEDAVVPQSAPTPQGARLCPLCVKPMERFRYLGSSPVELDSCPACFGVWAEDGELGQISELVSGKETPLELVELEHASNQLLDRHRFASQVLRFLSLRRRWL
jgi:Zn-finger nucleic acid-binding protein